MIMFNFSLKVKYHPNYYYTIKKFIDLHMQVLPHVCLTKSLRVSFTIVKNR